jgi:hypothetical protein
MSGFLFRDRSNKSLSLKAHFCWAIKISRKYVDIQTCPLSEPFVSKLLAWSYVLKYYLKNLKIFCMLTKGLRCAGADLLIRCLRPGVQCAVGGKSSEASRVFPPDFSRYPFRAGSTLAELTGSHHWPRSKPNNQRHQDSNPPNLRISRPEH